MRDHDSTNEIASADTNALKPKGPDKFRPWALWLIGTAVIAALALRYPGLAGVWLALASRMPHL